MKTFAGFALETGHTTFYKFSDNNTNDIKMAFPFTSGNAAKISMGNGAAIFMNM